MTKTFLSAGLLATVLSPFTLADEVPLETQKQKVSYIIGQDVGSSFFTQGVAEEFDTEVFLAAVKEGLVGAESKISPEDIQTIMGQFQTEFQAKQQAKQNALAKTNKEKGEAFLAKNKEREGVTTTESGLQYEVLTPAEGAKPTEADTVRVHYHGTLLDGTVFDSSVERKEPIDFPVGRVIPGWIEGMQLMTVGSKFKLFIPSDLAYGDQGTPNSPGRPGIPPASTLIFEVELIAVNPTEPVATPQAPTGE